MHFPTDSVLPAAVRLRVAGEMSVFSSEEGGAGGIETSRQ